MEKVIYTKQITSLGNFAKNWELRNKALSKEQKAKERNRFSKMKQRCYNKKDKDYKYYGARGIKICDEWLNDSKKYYLFAYLNHSYLEDMTIDRIDANKGYSPKNCRFINTAKNVTVNFIGSKQIDSPNFREYRDYGSLYESQYVKKYFGDVSEKIARDRRKSGWSVYESLKIPCGISRKTFWKEIFSKKRAFDNEIFLQRSDYTAIYPTLDEAVYCPKCNEKSLYLRFERKAFLECENCKYLKFIQTV